jgi:HlyD family type I secretion membrane fusion protein
MVTRLGGSGPALPAVPQSFDPEGDYAAREIIRLRMRRPIVLGMLVVVVLVFGALLWASLAPIAGAAVASGTVRVENNSKTLRHREGGVIRKIYVREGQKVRAGQVLIQFDRVQSQASVDIYRSAYDTALANIARFQAEADNAAQIHFPQELLDRQSDPQVQALLDSQRMLFQTRMALYRSEATVLAGQARQLVTQIGGLRAQAAAADAQSGLVDEELTGVSELEKQGYAPRSRLLALQRSAAGIKGQRGSITSDIARARQSIGEIQLQIAQLNDKRQTDAAQGLSEAQAKLTDAAPKLRQTASSLQETVVRAPVDGYVFNLTQYTEGGVAQPGEMLMQIVPANVPLLISAQIHPMNISDVRVGMPARVTLTAYNPRTTPQVDGTVTLVGADAKIDEVTKRPYYEALIKVNPEELAQAGPNVRLTPGMPVSVAVVTSSRTVMDYLLGPLVDAMRVSMREH